MAERLAALIVDESKWLTLSLALALVAVAVLVSRPDATATVRRRVLASLNLFFGVTIGTMALGHLLAVTVKLGRGTLEGSLVLFYVIGAALALPSWALIRRCADQRERVTLALNAWTAATLLALGLHNLPLAAPGLLNVGYHLQARPRVGWAIVAAAVVVNLGLLAGSLVFLASGQTFEQFRAREPR
jgi:hypothetical protein